MRKITQQAVEAFKAGRKFKSGNTEVIINSSNEVSLLLYNNVIAYTARDGKTFISNAGWKSNTTKERLNGLGAGIFQKDFKWYWKDGVQFPNNEFINL